MASTSGQIERKITYYDGVAQLAYYAINRARAVGKKPADESRQMKAGCVIQISPGQDHRSSPYFISKCGRMLEPDNPVHIRRDPWLHLHGGTARRARIFMY
jgi:hypothetical protein